MRMGDYPTPAQVTLYLEEVWVDDAYRVEFRKQNPKTPLYGFDEKYFSNVADGQVLVSGNLVINYRYPGYLWNIIAERSTRMDPEALAHNVFASELLAASPAKKIDMIKEARNNGTLNEVTSVMKKITAKNKGHYPSAPDLVNQILKDGNGRYKPINIKIYFDKPDRSWYHTEIVDVHFTGSSMTISASGTYGGDSSASGQPLFEVYSFFAKNVKPKNTTKVISYAPTEISSVQNEPVDTGSRTPTPPELQQRVTLDTQLLVVKRIGASVSLNYGRCDVYTATLISDGRAQLEKRFRMVYKPNLPYGTETTGSWNVAQVYRWKWLPIDFDYEGGIYVPDQVIDITSGEDALGGFSEQHIRQVAGPVCRTALENAT